MPAKKTKNKQIGEILLEREFISQDQLDKALELQLKEGGLLGQIMVKLGFVTQEQIEKSIFEQTSGAQNLENILIETGAVTSEQVEAARSLQKKEGGILAGSIIKMGVLGEEDLVSIFVTQRGVPYLQLANYEIDAEIVKVVPEKIAKKYCLIPIDKIGNILTLAMADPLDVIAQDEVRKVTGLNVEVFIATISDITNAMKQYYAS